MAALKQESAYEYETDEDMAQLWAHEMKFHQLEIFENSGHFAFVEEPDIFYRVIKEFVLNV